MSALIKLRIAPGAKRSEVVGQHGEAIRIKVAAPPVDGKANEALLEFIAETLGLPARAVSLKSGEKSRDKVVAIEGLTAEEAAALLLKK